jgi:outer membrane protein assembly factor BamB
MSLQGDLAELQIGELLQTLTLNNHEGTLRVRSEKEGDKYFYLSKGEIQLVSPGKKGLRLGDALMKAGKVKKDDLDRAVKHQVATGKKIGEALVELEIVAESDIEAVIHQQFREEFFEIFLLTKGQFEFHFRTKPDQIVQFDETVSRVSVNTSSLMLEALRQIDEWQVMSKTITTPRAILKSDGPNLDDVVAEASATDDVKKAVALIDGKNTVAEIVEKTPATKFDVYAFLHQLLEKHAIRPLTHEECSDQALGAEVGGDTYAATQYYEFGVFLDPDDLEMREKQFKLLKRLAVYKEAKEAALAIADRKLESKELEAALSYYLEAAACDERDLRAAEGVFRASLAIGTNAARSSKAGDEYVKLAIRNHELKRAREALASLIELEPAVVRRKIQLADLQEDDVTGRGEAVRLLDEALAELTKPEDAPLKAEAARKLAALDARRTDARQKLKEAVETQEQTHRRKIRNILVANGAGLVLIAGAYFGSAEFAARKAFAEAESVMNSADDAGKLAEAKELFRLVRHDYPHSSVASRAQASLGELDAKLKTVKTEEDKRRELAEQQRHATSAEARKQVVLDMLKRAEAAERSGNYREAAEAKIDVVRDYSDVKLDQRIRVPIPVTSDPPGAKVTSGDGDVSATPTVVYGDPFKPSSARVELRGYLPRDLSFKGDRYEEANLKLDRTALWTFKTGGAIEAAPVLTGGRVLVCSRDGSLYAVDAESGKQLWPAHLAEYGDRLSSPGLVAGKCVIGTTDGLIEALDPATGAAAWNYAAEGSVRNEVTGSLDGALAGFGCSTGIAHFLRSANGQRAFTLKTDGRIEAAVAFGPGRAYVASRDAKVYALDTAKGTVAWSFAGGDDFLAAPVVVGDVVVAGARNGEVYGIGAADGKERWRVATNGRIRAPGAASGSTVAIASEDGVLYAIDARTGSGLWKFQANSPIAAGPVVAEKGIYVAATSGVIQRVDPATGAPSWRFAVGSSVLASPVVGGGKVYVGSVDGVLRALLE